MSGTPDIITSCARGIAKPCTAHAVAGLIAVLAVVAASERASALSKEQAIETCRANVGHPIVQACMVLITEEEAKLPPPRGAVATDRRGITRGPKIELVADTEPVHSPTLKFEWYGGAKIDPNSVKVTYLRSPNVDLTDRVKAFVQATGSIFRMSSFRRATTWFGSTSRIRTGALAAPVLS